MEFVALRPIIKLNVNAQQDSRGFYAKMLTRAPQILALTTEFAPQTRRVKSFSVLAQQDSKDETANKTIRSLVLQLGA